MGGRAAQAGAGRERAADAAIRGDGQRGRGHRGAVALCARSGRSEPGRWTLIPQELHTPIDQALAVIKGTPHEAAARAFAAFVNGPQGRPIMRKYGFVLPGEEPRHELAPCSCCRCRSRPLPPS